MGALPEHLEPSARLAQRRLPRVLGRRFRQGPQAYLQALEERLVKPGLPPYIFAIGVNTRCSVA